MTEEIRIKAQFEEEAMLLDFDAPETTVVAQTPAQGIYSNAPRFWETHDGKVQIAHVGDKLYLISYYEEANRFEKFVERKDVATESMLRDLEDTSRYRVSYKEKFNLVFGIYLTSLRDVAKKMEVEL